MTYSGEIISDVATLHTNIEKFPHCPIVSTENLDAIPYDREKQSNIQLSFNTSKLERECSRGVDKNIVKSGENELYFERPMGPILAQAKLNFDQNKSILEFNKSYMRLGKATIDQFYSPGHLFMDFLNWRLLQSKYTLLHAAAFEYQNEGVVLIGLSNAGKTTTTLDFLSTYGGNFVAEDIAVIDGETVYSCPYSLSPIDPSFTDSKKHKYYAKLDNHVPLLDRFFNNPMDSILDVIGKDSFVGKTSIDHIFVLSGEGPKPESMYDIILSSNRAEFTYSANQLLWAAQYRNLINMEKTIQTEETLLQDAINSAETHILSVPPEQYTEQIHSFIT